MSKQIFVCALSLIAFATSVLGCLIVLFRKTEGKGRFFAGRKTIIFTGFLLLALWFFNLAISLKNSSIEFVSFLCVWPERIPKIIGCLVDSLKFFGADASFDEFVSEMGKLAKAGFNVPDSSVPFFRIYASLIYLLAPVAGGAVVFDLITSIFPKVKLSFAFFRVWREIFYFSELNEQTLTMAKSIMKEKNNFLKKGLKPIIVFTDAYIDEKHEKSTELSLSAKNLGAICISDDLLHIRIRPFKKKIFLVDENDNNNIRVLVSLTKNKKALFLRNAEIYFFTHSNAIADVGDKVKSGFLKDAHIKKAPKIIAVNPFRNLSRNLLFDLPLYAPLVGRNSSEKTLNVTIMGTDNIGTEMFLSTYWYGQIYGYELCINVISKESEKEFVDKINFINPDIFDSCVRVRGVKRSEGVDEAFSALDGTTKNFANIMRKYYQKDGLANPYFKFRYYQTNVADDDLEVKVSEKLWEDDFKIIDSDYLFVSVGSDGENLAVSDKMRTFVSLYHKEEKMKNSVITYVLYDTELTEFMKEENERQKGDVYMYALGGLSDVYDIENICMKKNEKQIKTIKDSYDKIAKKMTKDNYMSQQYEYWANIARAYHLRYKVFSAGKIKTSVFEKEKMTENDGYDAYVDAIQKDDMLKCRLAWLEHRRWNAFMRTNGFKCPKDFTVYSSETKTHKNLDLKLHPCLVECDEERMDFFSLEETVSKDDFDMLDMFSFKAYHEFYKHKNPDDKRNFKQYDFPIYDFPLVDGKIDENYLKADD